MKKTKLISLLFAAVLLTGCAVSPFTQKSSKKEEGTSEAIPTSNPDSKSEGNKSSEQKSSSSEEGPVEHTHSWETTWTKDPEYHWHKCSGCSEIKDKAAHSWDAGRVTKEPGAYSTGVKTFTCTVCSQTKNEDIPATGGGETEGSFTFNETALNTPQEIHTTNQKNYLNFSKPYYSITGSDLNSFSATGASSLQKSSWAPKSVSVSWSYTAPSGKTVSKFQFLYGQRSDLGDAYTVEGTTAQSISFVNPYLGDNYFKVIANFTDGTKEASPIKIFKVDTQAPRNLDVGNMPNCRDMGGRTTYAGGKVRQGMIYRTAGNKFDNRSSIDSACQTVLTKQLKVKTEINVANSDTNNVNLSGGKLVNAYMAYGATPYSNLARNSVRIRQVMDVLADESNYPVFYHCRIGTDRTGITGVMINGLLGVPFNEVIQDYGFSNFSPIDNQRYPGKTPDNNGDDIKKYIDEILAMPGNNFQEQTYNALLSIGCKVETLNTIINIMTEGTKANLSVKGVVGEGNSLSSTGTKKTSSDYKNPATYYECSSGKEVSVTATLSAGEKDVVIYLGGSDASTSTLLSNCLTLKIDGVTQTITNTKNLHTAGFGNTQQDSRIGYMFNILGKYNLAAGQHTVTVSVKSGSFNIATLAVYDHIEAA